MKQEELIRCLFDKEDSTCFSLTPRGIDILPVTTMHTNAAFFSINPMDQSKTRSDGAVTTYRNILIEMDKMPLEEQDEYISTIGLPYSTAVFSGSKSIHYIISLEIPISSESEYRALVKRIYKAVGDTIVDQANKNPSRFSRLPGHIRGDTGKEQKLLCVNGRVPIEALEGWLESRGAPKEDLWEILSEPRSLYKNPVRLYPSTKSFLMYGAPRGEWNQSLFKSAADLCRCGYTEEEAMNELLKITGSLDFTDRKTISSGFKNELSKTNTP